MCIWKVITSHILYAKEKGYIPVVDLQNYKTQYFKDERQGKDNVWEYFFPQPGGISLSDISDDDTILLGSAELSVKSHRAPNPYEIPENKNAVVPTERLEAFRDMLVFSPQFEQYLKTKFDQLIGEDSEYIGILARGTDYTNLKPHGHCRQPSPLELIRKTREQLNRTPTIKKIYLATEDLTIYKLFKQEFGDMLITNDQYRFTTNQNQYIADLKNERPNHSYELAKSYLTSLYILSRCSHFIAGRTAGTIAVFLMSNLFRDMKSAYIYTLGHYFNKYIYRLHIGNFDILSKKKIDNKRIYRIFGIPINITKN